MKNNDIKTVFVSAARVLRRYNLTIFIVILASGLSASVLMLSYTLQKSSDTSGYISTSDITSFDQVTIDRVKQLHTSSEYTIDTPLPSGRINPFAE